MPLCTLHLVALSTDLPTFLTTLRKTNPQPLLISRVIRWVIKPTTLSVNPLLTQTSPPWTLLLIYPDTSGLASSLQSSAAAIYTLQIGIPSRILSSFPATNKKLLYPSKDDTPALTGALEKPRLASSAQNLELTDELRSWIDEYDPDQSKGAVSMLNFLAFNPGMHSEYLKYGKAFAESIGSRRGGNAKIVGKVVGAEDGGWEEVALAHYPSIWHFADMAGSEDYQAVNKKHRVGSLKDTCILMTSELALPDAGSVEEKAKL